MSEPCAQQYAKALGRQAQANAAALDAVSHQIHVGSESNHMHFAVYLQTFLIAQK